MNGKALLIIHDPAIVQSLSKALMRPDLALDFSNTVGGGLATLSRNKTAIVFCEARLPDGSFREVVRFLGTLGQNIPIVVCANFYDRAADAEANILGAHAYLTYPFVRRRVQQLADRAIRGLTVDSRPLRSRIAA